MVKFNKLGFDNFESYKNEFLETLLNSNKTYDYFVNWQKIKTELKRYLNELSLLNSLTKINLSERGNYLENLLLEFPKISEVIPILIAERLKNGKIEIFDIELNSWMVFEFAPDKINKENSRKIVQFCFKTGIMDLFDEIKDLIDYLFGLEVGIDTNTRKNRSGDIFEKMCQKRINEYIPKEYNIIKNDKSFSLYNSLFKGKGKTHDFLVYKEKTPIMIIECNFYNTPGSKPISIAESYIEMNLAAKKKNIIFLWITDGPAWKKMQEPLIRSMNKIDWILNYKLINLIKNILN